MQGVRDLKERIIKLKELEDFVNNTEFDNEPIDLDVCTKILDKRTFAESHLQILKSNSGKIIAMPYYWRLVNFYKLIKNIK